MNAEVLARNGSAIRGNRPVGVLLVEDDLGDAVLIRESFKRSGMPVQLHHVVDGVECMAFLRNERDYGTAPTPDLILLDLYMPRMDGFEVLAALTSDEAISHLPVVILSVSPREEDILRAYRLGCNSYIVKPANFENFHRVAQAISDYWLERVVLP